MALFVCFPPGYSLNGNQRVAYSYEKFIEAANMKNDELQNNGSGAILFDLKGRVARV
jgi:hypothetical protein